jgi:FkbM family methyltransferase
LDILAFSFALKALGRDLSDADHEPEVPFMKDLLGPEPMCLHVGASDGRHSFAILKARPKARVMAFEPSTFGVTCMKQGVWLRGLGKKIEVVQAAVGDAPGELTLVTPRKKRGIRARAFAFIASDKEAHDRADFAGYGHFEEKVKVVKLDDLKLPPVEFIRMDIEGAELLALTGAKALLERDRPHLLIEIHPIILEQRFSTKVSVIEDLFRSLGYVFAKVEDGKLVPTDTLTPDVHEGRFGDFFVLNPNRAVPEGPFSEIVKQAA